MKKNFLLVISFCFTTLLFCNMVSAQAPTGVIGKATTAPLIDGVVDAIWANAIAYNIDKPLRTETPTLGTSGQTTWQALWTNDGIYILLKVADDAFYPNYAVTPAGNNWEYDKPEIYFDVNDVLADGLGSKDNKGHYQVAPGFPQGKVDGTKNTQSDGIAYAFLVTGQTYIAEYFVPYTKLVDKLGVVVKKFNTIGFDVQIIDRDPSLSIRRAVWANTGAINESYNNMDGCGHVTHEGVPAPVYVSKITLNSAGTITTDNASVQMYPTIVPANADKQTMTWSVTNGTGKATISSTGLLSGLADGTVTVKAVATDGSNVSATIDIVIYGQVVDIRDTFGDKNLIKNWNFDTNLTSWGGWVDGGVTGQVSPVVQDGVVVMKVGKASDGQAWHYQHNQENLTALANTPYTLRFKSWANVDNTPCAVDFEDTGANGNKRYGTSTDAGNVNGASEWNYKANITPEWFTYHVVFDKMVPSTVQKLQWMLSLSSATIYLDSVLLIKDADLPVVTQSITLNTGGTITTRGGTLQMVATVMPAIVQEIKWSVSPSGIATISSKGLLTAIADGTVTVTAATSDGSLKVATANVVISGQGVEQVIDLFNDFNLIKNWNFDTNMTSWGGWVDTTPAGMVAPVVTNGVCVMKVAKSAAGEAWHYQHNQEKLTAEANIKYTLKFKSWASADGTPSSLDFEDTPANSYKRYGTSTDAEAIDGGSEWHYTVDVTPKWFTYHVVFDKMVPSTVQKIQWMLSSSDATIYLDSVLLIKDADLDANNAVLVTTLDLNTGGTITTVGGTLQMVATVGPIDASNKKLNWSVTPEGIATISPTGLVKAITDGTVTVKAVAADGSLVQATADVVISGQGGEVEEEVIDLFNDFNLIKNWNFDTDMTSWGGWVDGTPAGMIAPVVKDGTAEMKVGKSADNWHYQHSQTPLTGEANIKYTLKFKSWATADATPCAVDFESGSAITPANGGDQYARYGTTTDAESADGASEWHYNVNVIPKWFTFHVTFDKMIPTTVQKIQWMLSSSNETIYLDSVLLVKDSDMPVLATKITLATGGTITTEGGVYKMVTTFEPETVSSHKLTWSVTPEGVASISSTGVVKGIANGTVTVKAVTMDGSMLESTADVVISGQGEAEIDLFNDFNLIKNWNFDTDMTSWGGWVDGTPAGMVAPVVKDGAAEMKVAKSPDTWHYQHSQTPLTAEANIKYTLKFKSWATADATPCAVDFESGSAITPANGGDQYARYGTSADAEAIDGGSEWHYTVGVTPKWFTYHVTFDKMIPTTVQKIQWMLSSSNETIYLDSVLLVKDSDMGTPATKITLATGGTITTDGGIYKMVTTFEPETVTNKKLTWSVTPEGVASISSTGVVRGITNGTVTVKAVTTDGSFLESTADVVVSGQVDETALWSGSNNLIKNWNFDTDLTSWGGWIDTTPAGMVAPVVKDGAVEMKVAKSADNWHYQHSQSPLTAEANVPYTLKFKSWASTNDVPCAVDFEDTADNSYNRYGITTDPESADGKSEWHYNVNVIPTWFTFHVTFDKMVPTTVQKLQWMLSSSNETLYLDSVLLIKDSEFPVIDAPVANAGEDQSVNEGETVTLNGSVSSDPNANALTYRWIAPAGVTLSSTAAKNPTFVAPDVTADKTYTLSLIVGYGTVSSTADQVVVTVKQIERAPVANAGADQSVNEGATVTLNGSTSADPEGLPVTYLWTAPAGITLSSATEVKPTFTAPEVSVDKTYTFKLVVNDGTANSIVDEIVVTVKQVDKAPYLKAAIPNVSVIKGAAVQEIDLKTVFGDDDLGDVLTYTVTSANDQVVGAVISVAKLTLTFTDLNKGTAEVVVTATSNGKEVKSTFTVEVKFATGINPMDNEANLQVYPNPTKGQFKLNFSQTPKVGTIITVYNYSGQEVLKTVAGDMIVNLDLSGNPAGLYFIKVNQKTFKLVVE